MYMRQSLPATVVKFPSVQADSAAGAGFGWANCEAGIVTGETETVERGRLVQERLGLCCGQRSVRAVLSDRGGPSGCHGFAFSLSALCFAGCRCACRNPTPLRHGTPLQLHSAALPHPPKARSMRHFLLRPKTHELRENVKPRLGHVFGRFLRDPGIPFDRTRNLRCLGIFKV